MGNRIQHSILSVGYSIIYHVVPLLNGIGLFHWFDLSTISRCIQAIDAFRPSINRKLTISSIFPRLKSRISDNAHRAFCRLNNFYDDNRGRHALGRSQTEFPPFYTFQMHLIHIFNKFSRISHLHQWSSGCNSHILTHHKRNSEPIKMRSGAQYCDKPPHTHNQEPHILKWTWMTSSGSDS